MVEPLKVSLWVLSPLLPPQKTVGWNEAQEKGSQTLFIIRGNTTAIRELCKDFTFLHSTTNTFFTDMLGNQTHNCMEWESTKQ